MERVHLTDGEVTGAERVVFAVGIDTVTVDADTNGVVAKHRRDLAEAPFGSQGSIFIIMITDPISHLLCFSFRNENWKTNLKHRFDSSIKSN